MAKKKEVWYQQFAGGISLSATLFNLTSLVLVVTIATLVGTILLWKEHQAAIVELDDYVLTPDKIVINDSPDGESDKLKALIVAPDKEDVQLTILDPGLVNQTANRLKKVGWVQSVQRIVKSRSGMTIEVEYRLPVGLVELNRVTVLKWRDDSPDRLLPVDRYGVVLPQAALVNRRLLRFTIFEPRISSDNEDFSAIADDRIQGCAEIAGLLESHWRDFGFYRITTLRPAAQPSDSKIPFELWTDTRTATKVIWGNPPGKELPGEVPAKTKLQVLEQLFAEHGAFNEMPPTMIDIRQGKPIMSRNKTAEANPSRGKLTH
jgi:hypothetical protein